MEAAEENGGSFSVDLNENEEGGGGGAALRSYVALKDRSTALLLGISGAPEAGKAHVYVTGNGRNVGRDASASPPPHRREIVLDLVAAEGYLPARLTDSCGISEVCGGLNGFTESPGQEEATMVGLDGGQGGGGPTAASCPAVLRALVSTETGRQMRQHPPGESEGESPDSDDGSPADESTDCAAVTGCIRTALPRGRLSCPGKLQRRCVCPTAAIPCAEENMHNGSAERTGCEADVGSCKHTGVFSSPALGHTHSSSNVACGEEKVANGGVVSPCDRPDAEYSPRNTTEPRPERCCCDLSRASVCRCPGEDAPTAAGPSHSPELPKSPPALGSSANPPSAWTPSGFPVDAERPLSEPGLWEDEDGHSNFSFPVRPRTLRTNPNLAVSLSCDATPLSPDEDGAFYFGGDGYAEDLRTVLEAGRRQSAPDKLPERPEHTDGPDSKLMPKRFGIADFFTR